MVLPTLNSERIDAMQHQIMQNINSYQLKKRRRVQGVISGGALVGILAVAALIGGSFNNLGRNSNVLASLSSDSVMFSSESGALRDVSAEKDMAFVGDSAAGSVENTLAQESQYMFLNRQIVRTAELTLVSDNIAPDIQTITKLVNSLHGFVEQQIQTGIPQTNSSADDASQQYFSIEPQYRNYRGQSSMTVRVPADKLDQFLDEVGNIGQVIDLGIDQADITSTVADVDARIRSLTVSVERLEELLQKAEISDMIAIEKELAVRQGDLESLEAQREYYLTQVAMSTVRISFSETAKAVELAPEGFWGGLLAGWNSLIIALGGIIVGLGVMLPWLGVLGVGWFIIWMLLTARRKKTTP